jgi:FlaG/FlaF family flagellin (archaellin)
VVDLRTSRQGSKENPDVFIRFTLKEGSSMSLQLPIVLAVTFAIMFSPNVSTARAPQKSLTSEQKQVVDTVNTIFSAASTEDIAKLDSVIAPDFYIFANGMRFNGDTLMAAIKAQHPGGKRTEEQVTEPNIRITGNTAWIAYVNKGSITDASGTVDQNWLESAFLEKQAGTWKIVFMHSTRVPVATQENQCK